MRAVVVRSYGGPEVLEISEVPVPAAGPGELRIKVAAAAVNPVDAQTRSGALTAGGLLPARKVVGIGWDVAGTVEKLGQGVTGFSAGELVIGLSDRLPLPAKAQADYVVLDARAVAKLSAGADLIAASTLPLNGLTAAQALDCAGVRAGQSLLVTGAAGAVGGFAVELAALRGVTVVATAGDRDEKLVRDLGASFFVPRGVELSPEIRKAVPGGVDAVIDAANIGMPALDAVRVGGTFVSVLGEGPVPLRGIRVASVWIRADGTQLADLVAANLRLRVARTMPLGQVADAHRLPEKGGLRGRLVLVP